MLKSVPPWNVKQKYGPSKYLVKMCCTYNRILRVNFQWLFLLSNKGCSEISTEECPECLSGESSCPEIDDECWIRGSCIGAVITEVRKNFTENS